MKTSNSKTIHRSRVGSSGGAIAVRLPQAAAQSLALREGTTVEKFKEGNAQVFTSSKPPYTLDGLVQASKGLVPPDPKDDGATGSEHF